MYFVCMRVYIGIDRRGGDVLVVNHWGKPPPQYHRVSGATVPVRPMADAHRYAIPRSFLAIWSPLPGITATLRLPPWGLHRLSHWKVDFTPSPRNCPSPGLALADL